MLVVKYFSDDVSKNDRRCDDDNDDDDDDDDDTGGAGECSRREMSTSSWHELGTRFVLEGKECSSSVSS